jgi:hypothetical protein
MAMAAVGFGPLGYDEQEKFQAGHGKPDHGEDIEVLRRVDPVQQQERDEQDNADRDGQLDPSLEVVFLVKPLFEWRERVSHGGSSLWRR